MPAQPPYGSETKGDLAAPCPTHEALSDLLYPNFSWTYYAITTGTSNGGANLAGSIWTAPNSLSSICIPEKDSNGLLRCAGKYWEQGDG
jgi:hypothetical protein